MIIVSLADWNEGRIINPVQEQEASDFDLDQADILQAGNGLEPGMTLHKPFQKV